MKDIYLTSTFTNPWNVKFNALIGEALESNGLSCFLPHRDTNQTGLDADKFKSDIIGIQQASILFAIAENESPNWGAEVGFAYGIGKKILALANINHKIPLICNGMISELKIGRAHV